MKKIIGILMVTCLFLAAGPAQAAEYGYAIQGGTLSNTADYAWWYGCSPTSAGMLMGYYDLNGYDGLLYDNLVPGVAETSTYPSQPYPPYQQDYNAQAAIASAGHVADFYVSGYGASGDDQPVSHSFDCLADFMGTSQDSVGNSNGSTSFYFRTDGGPTTTTNIVNWGVTDIDGMYGVGEYIDYTGYDTTSLFTQLTDNDYFDIGFLGGFTFDDYMAEIDAGRPVMIHVAGHTMAGIGYDGSDIVLYDTWAPGPYTMPWGGTYSGLELWGVTAFTLTGGDAPSVIPVPGAFVLASIGVVFVTRRRKLKGC